MKAARFLSLLLLTLIALTTFAVRPARQTLSKEGTYDFRLNYVVWMVAKLTLTPAGNGTFTVTGTLQAEDPGPNSKLFNVTGTLGRDGKLKAQARIAGKGDEGGSPIDGLWDDDLQTLVVTHIEKRVVYGEGKRASTAGPKVGGTYKGERTTLQFILTKSANPDQFNVIGRTREFYNNPFEVRGTYFLKRNAFTAFGETRGREEKALIKIDGKFSNGVFKVRYVVTIPEKDKPLLDVVFDCIYQGNPELDPIDSGPKKDPKKDPTPKPSRGSLGGSATTDRASAKVGETIKLNLSYTLKGRDEDTIQESVALYGPAGALMARSDKERSLVAGSPSKRAFDIKCHKPGAYTVSVRVKGELSDEWKETVAFKVESPKPKTDTAKAATGSYGLVEKITIKSPPPEENGQGYTHSASISESSLIVKATPHAGVFFAYTITGVWSAPPAQLKPGQEVTLPVSMTVAVSEKDPPNVNPGAWYSFEGSFQVLEQKAATVGNYGNGRWVPSSEGVYRAKVSPNASGGELRIAQRYTGPAFGNGPSWVPCVYVYKWNATPMKDDKTDPGKTEEESEITSTTMVLTTPEEKKQIRATLSPDTITINAGEPSKIVDITISGFRTSTLDRVEVVFPQATDGWASLPGQIVAGGGAGSYDPANMNRPNHTDGYFFSARSTAPDSEQVIDIIVRQKDAGQVRLKLKVKVVGKPTLPVGASGDQWTATWTQGGNPWNPMVLARNGNTITGTFWKGQAKIKGTVAGDKFTFTFENYYGKSGKGDLTLSEDGQTLTGHYYEEGEDTRYTLNLKRAIQNQPTHMQQAPVEKNQNGLPSGYPEGVTPHSPGFGPPKRAYPG